MTPLFFQASDRIDSTLGFRFNIHTKTTNSVTVHYHDYYELLFLPSESCEHLSNGKVVCLPCGSLMFIRPDDRHDFINTKLKKITILNIAIHSDIIQKLFALLDVALPSQQLMNNAQPPYVVLDAYEVQSLTKKLNRLNQISPEKVQEKVSTMLAILTDVFATYFTSEKLSLHSTSDKIPLWLISTYNQMQKLENFSLGIDRMVELSGVTKEWVCHSFKKYYNCTPSEFVNNLRLTYIANMLLHSDMKIVDLCYDSGFSSVSWFHSQFVKKYGCSPGQYRKENTSQPSQLATVRKEDNA